MALSIYFLVSFIKPFNGITNFPLSKNKRYVIYCNTFGSLIRRFVNHFNNCSFHQLILINNIVFGYISSGYLGAQLNIDLVSNSISESLTFSPFHFVRRIGHGETIPARFLLGTMASAGFCIMPIND